MFFTNKILFTSLFITTFFTTTFNHAFFQDPDPTYVEKIQQILSQTKLNYEIINKEVHDRDDEIKKEENEPKSEYVEYLDRLKNKIQTDCSIYPLAITIIHNNIDIKNTNTENKQLIIIFLSMLIDFFPKKDGVEEAKEIISNNINDPDPLIRLKIITVLKALIDRTSLDIFKDTEEKNYFFRLAEEVVAKLIGEKKIEELLEEFREKEISKFNCDAAIEKYGMSIVNNTLDLLATLIKNNSENSEFLAYKYVTEGTILHQHEQIRLQTLCILNQSIQSIINEEKYSELGSFMSILLPALTRINEGKGFQCKQGQGDFCCMSYYYHYDSNTIWNSYVLWTKFINNKELTTEALYILGHLNALDDSVKQDLSYILKSLQS